MAVALEKAQKLLRQLREALHSFRFRRDASCMVGMVAFSLMTFGVGAVASWGVVGASFVSDVVAESGVANSINKLKLEFGVLRRLLF